MDREDIINMIKMTDDLEKLDMELKVISGMGHGSGSLTNIDNVYELLMKYSHEYYSEDDNAELFYNIIADVSKSPEERADILMNGTVRYDEKDNVINFPVNM